MVVSQEMLDKILLALASNSNEWNTTVAWPASRAMVDMAATEIPIHLHALLAGLIPPFSDFFNAIISHYQVHALQLDPQSILLLASLPSYARPRWALFPPWPYFAISF